MKNVTLSRPQKGRLFIVCELKQEGRVLPYSASAGNTCERQLEFLASLYTSANAPRNAARIDFGLTKILESRSPC